MIKDDDSRHKLISLLQLAYSGELAAAYAYRGHWQSVSDKNEIEAIRNIEEDEWRHRKLVGEMLTSLGSGPNQRRELRATIIGRALGLMCHVSGWLAPMYGAGRLESRNVREYETAARHARDCRRVEFIDCLLEMAEVEWEHEFYFRSRVLSHSLGRRLSLWPQPAPKETIRLTFESERIGDSPPPGTHASGVLNQGTPDECAPAPVRTSAAGVLNRGTPEECAPPAVRTSAAGVLNQGTPEECAPATD